MLVIGRRPGEECLVLHKGEVLRLLVWTDQHHIKVGFDAPKSFTVVRAELKAGKHDQAERQAGVALLPALHQVDQVEVQGRAMEA